VTRALLCGLLLMVACSDEDPAAPERLRIDGLTTFTTLESEGGVHRVFLNITNESSAPVEVLWAGPCLIKPRLYRGSRLAFDGVTAFPFCPNDAYAYRVPAGVTFSRIWGAAIDGSALGDSLPRGAYRLVAAVRPQGAGGPVYELYAGTITF
jgi:hypothetical protein